MATAHRSCGAVTLTLPERAGFVVACHCEECQRRTGSAYGVGGYYPADQVAILGETREYVRPGSSGQSVRNHFCPVCGTTIYWYADRQPGLVGVAMGALSDPALPPPDRSIFEESKWGWVGSLDAAAHLPRGSGSPSR